MTTIFLFNFWAEISIALNSFRLQSFIRALLLFKIRLNKRGLFAVLNAKFDLPVIVVLFNNATAKITLINYWRLWASLCLAQARLASDIN